MHTDSVYIKFSTDGSYLLRKQHAILVESDLKVQMKMRLFTKINLFNAEVESESTAAKEHWTVRDIEEHQPESLEQRLSR